MVLSPLTSKQHQRAQQKKFHDPSPEQWKQLWEVPVMQAAPYIRCTPAQLSSTLPLPAAAPALALVEATRAPSVSSFLALGKFIFFIFNIFYKRFDCQRNTVSV